MRWRILVGLAVALGCASRSSNTLATGYEGAPGLKRFLACAPNTMIALPAELQGSTSTIRTEIDAYLRSHQREPQWLDLIECGRLLKQAIGEAKERDGVEHTPVFFARALDEHYDFDAIVMPSLFLHQARASSGYALWDGVRRRMGVLMERSFRGDQRGQQVAEWARSGEFMVTSLHVLVYDPMGKRIFEGRGGIDFVHALDLTKFNETRQIALKIRDDLPGGPDAVREGIAIAFAPLLPGPAE